MKHRLFRTSRLHAWIAIFAILVQALLPGVASARGTPGPLTEICTVSGIKQVDIDAGDAGSPHPQRHCPACVVDMPPLPA